eukprot:6542880-Pyramimonas_sp.AAC.1
MPCRGAASDHSPLQESRSCPSPRPTTPLHGSLIHQKLTRGGWMDGWIGWDIPEANQKQSALAALASSMNPCTKCQQLAASRRRRPIKQRTPVAGKSCELKPSGYIERTMPPRLDQENCRPSSPAPQRICCHRHGDVTYFALAHQEF